MDTLEASKLLDKAAEANSYSEKLRILIQSVFRTKKINRYEYERMINILTCNKLLTEDIKGNLERYIVNESNRQIRIDVRV